MKFSKINLIAAFAALSIAACGNRSTTAPSTTTDSGSTSSGASTASGSTGTSGTATAGTGTATAGTGVSVGDQNGVSVADSNGTTGVTVTVAGATKQLQFGMYEVNPNTNSYMVLLSDVDLCAWWTANANTPDTVHPGQTGFYGDIPQNATILTVNLLNLSGGTATAPTSGTYTVAANPTGTGTFLNNASGGSTAASGLLEDASCKHSYPGIAAGGTVAVSSVSNSGAQGTVNLATQNQGTITGSFQVAPCTGTESAPATNPAACSW